MKRTLCATRRWASCCPRWRWTLCWWAPSPGRPAPSSARRERSCCAAMRHADPNRPLLGPRVPPVAGAMAAPTGTPCLYQALPSPPQAAPVHTMQPHAFPHPLPPQPASPSPADVRGAVRKLIAEAGQLPPMPEYVDYSALLADIQLWIEDLEGAAGEMQARCVCLFVSVRSGGGVLFGGGVGVGWRGRGEGASRGGEKGLHPAGSRGRGPCWG